MIRNEYVVRLLNDHFRERRCEGELILSLFGTMRAGFFGYNDFADKLAWRRNRPAIDSRVREFVTLPLGDALRSGQVGHEPIVEMRLRCGPNWDRVDRAKLYAIVKDGAAVVPIEEQFVEWQESIAASIPEDFTLLPTDIVEIGSLRHRLSLETILVDYDDVSS
jgi:putative component of toxin-antitoxin plasmid stabilization module